jgi:hypothetical protein
MIPILQLFLSFQVSNNIAGDIFSAPRAQLEKPIHASILIKDRETL